MTHHSVMTSSLRIKILKIDKFCDFSCNIDYNSRTDVFRDVISLIINQCGPRRPNGTSGGNKVPASRAAQASEAKRACIYLIQARFACLRCAACRHCVSAESPCGRLELLNLTYYGNFSFI